MALQFQSRLLASRAVGEWDVVIGDVVEKVNLLLLQQQPSSDRVYGCVTPSFIEESAVVIQ